jgi:hypothetical protein
VPQEQELMLMAEFLMPQMTKPEKNQMKGPVTPAPPSRVCIAAGRGEQNSSSALLIGWRMRKVAACRA